MYHGVSPGGSTTGTSPNPEFRWSFDHEGESRPIESRTRSSRETPHSVGCPGRRRQAAAGGRLRGLRRLASQGRPVPAPSAGVQTDQPLRVHGVLRGHPTASEAVSSVCVSDVAWNTYVQVCTRVCVCVCMRVCMFAVASRKVPKNGYLPVCSHVMSSLSPNGTDPTRLGSGSSVVPRTTRMPFETSVSFPDAIDPVRGKL